MNGPEFTDRIEREAPSFVDEHVFQAGLRIQHLGWQHLTLLVQHAMMHGARMVLEADNRRLRQLLTKEP